MATHVTKCLSFVKGRRIRVTRLDGCGRPIYGVDSQAVSSGFITVNFTANTTESDEINVTNAAGEVCVYEASVTSLVGYGLEIQFCNVDPELLSLLTGQNVVLGSDGNTVVGFDVDTKVNLSSSRFALELWAGAPSGDACANPGATGSYGYILLPYLSGGILGDFTVENNNVTFTVTGANTKDGNAWGTGPYKDIMLNPASATAEVQTVTITGTPTGGSYTLTLAGQTTASIAYNAAAAVVQTAISALSNVGAGNVTVTGGPGPGTPWVATFAASLGNVAQMTATASLTGGTSPAVAVTTTTPGTSAQPGAMSTPVSTTTALRTMVVDLAPPTAACGARPLLDPSLPSLTALAGVKDTVESSGYTAKYTTTPASTGPVFYDFGDGTWDYVAAPGVTTHKYTKAGTYTTRASQNGVWVSATVTIPLP